MALFRDFGFPLFSKDFKLEHGGRSTYPCTCTPGLSLICFTCKYSLRALGCFMLQKHDHFAVLLSISVLFWETLPFSNFDFFWIEFTCIEVQFAYF